MAFVVAFLVTLEAVWLLAQPSGPRVDLSTYFGGTGGDGARVVRVDPAGNFYLAGTTNSRDFPTTNSVFPFPPGSGSTPMVGFLTKLRPDGAIVYSMYLARPVAALVVDAAGNAIFADNIPAFVRGGAIGDFVVSKLDPNGTELYAVRFTGSGLEQATALAADEAGGVIITGNTDSPDFPLLDPLQPAVLPGDDGFDRSAFVTRLDGSGRMIFSTGWGGTGEDLAAGVAVDRARSIYVVGTTRSIDFPTSANAFQRTLFSVHCSPFQSPCADAFVTKFSADGRAVVYSTLFGGTYVETAAAMAVDAAGSVHFAGATASADLPLRGAIQTTCDSARQLHGCSSYIARLSPTGSALEYATYVGSRAEYVFGLGLDVASLAIDRDGGLVATGVTRGNDLPLARPLLGLNGGGPLFKSTDEGRSWTSTSGGITGTGIWFLAAGGRTSQTLYASTFGQLFRSDDQGRRWLGPRGGNDPRMSTLVAVDPLSPETLYAIGNPGWLKSTDGGESWMRLSLDRPLINHIALAPSSPSNVYVAAQRGVFHSPNGGITWSLVLDVDPTENPARPGARLVAVDPRDAEMVYVGLSDGTVRRKDGQSWSPVGSLPCPVNQLLFAAAPPPTIYALACGDVWKSIDAGSSWLRTSLERMAASIALDRSSPDDVYVAASTVGIYRSRDRGETWTLVSDAFDHDFRSILVDPFPVRTIYAGATEAANAFVLRFDPSGQITFSTYLGGVQSTGQSVNVLPGGSLAVAGSAGRNFPLIRPFQSSHRGATDAFLTLITISQ